MMESIEEKRDWSRWQPEKVLPDLVRRIDSRYWLAFGAAFVLGLITHIYMFVNKLPNGDDLESMYRNYDMTSSGRWFDQIAMSLSSWYSIPWTTGLVALFFLALSTALLCSLFAYKRKSSVLITAALMATFPVLASQFSYLFYADLYMIAMCLSIWAIWLAKRHWWGIVPGVLALACAMGCYQAYIGFAVVVCMLSLIAEVVRNEQKTSAILLLAVRYLVTGALGVALYFGILHGALAVLGETLTDYQGINEMGQLPAGGILAMLPGVYRDFWAYFFQGTYFQVPAFFRGLYALVLAVGALLLVYGVIKRGAWKRPQIVVLLAMAAALPIGYNLIYFMAPQAYLHCLMQPQYTLFLIMPVIFFECAFDGQKPSFLSEGSSWILLLASCLIAYQFYLLCNVCYLNLDLRYEITYATELRILDRIEQLDGYETDTPVAFIGAFPNKNMNMYPDGTADATWGLTGVRGNLVHHEKNYRGFYLNYLGKRMNVLSEDACRAYYDEARTMPYWPENGSVAMVDGVVIVHIWDVAE